MPLRPLAAALLAVLTLAACERQRSINLFAKSSPSITYCRAALDYLVARETEKEKISVREDAEKPRDNATAVTIDYTQGESRRLFTCLFAPELPNVITAGSYRGQGLTPAQLDQINAALAERR
jgi:hypothetical protein